MISVHLWGWYSLYKRKCVAWEGVAISSAGIPSCVRRGHPGHGGQKALVELRSAGERFLLGPRHL